MHGYTVDEIRRMGIRELDVFKDRTLPDCAEIIRSMEARGIARFEVEHYHKDGHIFPLNVTTSIIHLNGQKYFLAFHQDITMRKRAEDALRESKSRMRAFTDTAQDAIIMMDSEGLISYWNPSTERILG